MRTPGLVRTVVALAAISTIGASPCAAQTRVTSLDELRRELAEGDVITLVPATGQPVKGRVVRLGRDDLDVRDITIRFDGIRSLHRPRDSTRNGALLGAGIGAGFAGALFIYALAVDRNEIDEWGPIYAGFAGVATGIGALTGWGVDKAHSKPEIRFDASPGRQVSVSVHPTISRGRGIGLAVTVAR
jgi:hypothetical protein